MHDFSIQPANWKNDQSKLKAIRHAVFIIEQTIPKELEWDRQDIDALHLLAINNDAEPIGTVRLLRTGQIGRMAVLKKYRGKGVGKLLMEAVLKLARQNRISSVFLHAQSSAITFYGAFDFIVTSKEYEEAGIPHVNMKKILIN